MKRFIGWTAALWIFLIVVESGTLQRITSDALLGALVAIGILGSIGFAIYGIVWAFARPGNAWPR